MQTGKKFITAVMIMAMVFTLAMPMTAQAKATPKLNKTKISLDVKTSYQLRVKGVSKKVVWKSNNKKVATISKNGKVTGKKKGTAVITAKVGQKTLKCKVTVRTKAATKVKLNKTKVSLDIAKTKTCQLKVKGTSKKITWKTSNKKVAAVSKTGMITARKKGTAVITATVGKKTYKCKVTVKDTRKNDPQKEDTTKEETEDPKSVAIHPIKKDNDGYFEGPRYQCTCGTPLHADIEGEWERHVWFFCEQGTESTQEHQLIPIEKYEYPNIACSCGLCFRIDSSVDDTRKNGQVMHDAAWNFYEKGTHGQPDHVHEDAPGNGCHSTAPICSNYGNHDNCPYH